MRQYTTNEARIEYDGKHASVGGYIGRRWLVLNFEVRKSRLASEPGWEYRPEGGTWGYSVMFDSEREMLEQMVDDYHMAEEALTDGWK